MGISLNGLTPAGTYPGLIKTGDNTAISGTPKVLSDGNGNNLPMEVSTAGVNLTGSPTVNAVAIANTTQVAAKQDTLVSGTNIKTVNSTTILGSGNLAVQDVLVSGTNIKTINGTSLLGSGNIPVVTSPSGVSGAIQFSNGSAFASDAANLFWDDTNNRLGVLTNTPSFPVDVAGEIRSTTQVSAGATGTNGTFLLRRTTDGNGIGSFSTSGNEVLITEFSGSGGRLVTGFGTTALKWLGSSSQPRVGIGFNGSILATAHIQGSGSTSATTSLLVQNSAGTQLFKVADDNGVVFGTVASLVNRARFGTYLQIKYDTPDIDIWQGGSGVGLRITNSGVLLAEFNDASGGGAIIRHSLSVGSASFASASARLQVDSTTQGFLPPRMTTTQKNAIATPAAGLVVYDSTTNKLQCYNGSTWNDLF
jgi:hypothetical protein